MDPHWANYARNYLEQSVLFGTSLSEMTVVVTPLTSPVPQHHPNLPVLQDMARLEGLGEDDVEGINWNITTESFSQPSNNTLPLHEQQDRNTWNHGFQNTGSKSFSTEDFFLGIKTKNCEFLGEQPKTSTPNTSTEVHDMGSLPPNNPMTLTPQEPRRSPTRPRNVA